MSVLETEVDADGGGTNEQSLAAAVVQQGIDDALQVDGERERTASDVAKAVLFCTALGGEWAAAREAWCDLAGINPESLRVHVVRELARRSRVAA